MVRPGARNLITDVAGLKVGQAEDAAARTGVTVVVADTPVTAVVDVRGGAPGTRDTDALDPLSLGVPVDALVLSGGSVFGLDAPSGVTAFLARHDRGLAFAEGAPKVPIVPGAVLFDLANGGDKEWGRLPPYRALGEEAAAHAAEDFKLGNRGAGYGARAGRYKGGVGSASSVTRQGFTVGALAAVNALGSPLIPGTDVFWSFALEQQEEFGGRGLKRSPEISLDLPHDMKAGVVAGQNTTIAVVATDADLTRLELKRMAVMAADGFARALRPAHTPYDGDLVFAVATDVRPLPEPRAFGVMLLGHLAADCLARAISRGVYEAQTIGAMKSYRDTFDGK